MTSLTKDEVQKIITDFNKIVEKDAAKQATKNTKILIIIVVVILVIACVGGYYYLWSKKKGNKAKAVLVDGQPTNQIPLGSQQPQVNSQPMSQQVNSQQQSAMPPSLIQSGLPFMSTAPQTNF